MTAAMRPVQIGDAEHAASGDFIVDTVLEFYDTAPNARVVIVQARGVVAKFVGGVSAAKLGFIAMRDDGAQMRVASVQRWSELKAEIDSWLEGFAPANVRAHAREVVRTHDEVARLERELARARRARNEALVRAERAGYTQYALADLLGESRTNVNRWANSARISVSYTHLTLPTSDLV